MTTAFQRSAFQDNAFQIDARRRGGVTVDTSGIDRQQNERFLREQEWKDDLRRIIDRAFDPAPAMALDEAAIEAEPEPDWRGMAVAEVEQVLKKRKADNDMLAVLLMAV